MKWVFASAILLAIGSLAVGLELWRDADPKAFRKWVLPVAVVGLFAIVWTFSLIGRAYPHDRGRPDLDAWFKGLTSRAKAACCDGSDATRLDDLDWESRDGRYRVRIYGEWIDVPEDAVIDGPNRAGPAMVWPTRGYLGLTIRCFMPGTMS